MAFTTINEPVMMVVVVVEALMKANRVVNYSIAVEAVLVRVVVVAAVWAVVVAVLVPVVVASCREALQTRMDTSKMAAL
jgi:hypothetical protein